MMQLLVILSLAMSVLAAQSRHGGTGLGSLALQASPSVRILLAIGSTAAVVLLCLAFNLRSARRLDQAGTISRRRYRRGLTLLAWGMLAVFAGQLFYLDWATAVLPPSPEADGVGRYLSAAPALGELLAWLPFAVMLAGFWASAWLVDVRMRLADMRRRLAVGMPIYAPGGLDRPIWSLGQYLAFQFRFHVLLVLLPLVAILVVHSLVNWGFGHVESALSVRGLGRLAGPLYALVWLTLLGGIFVIAPAFLVKVFATEPLPLGSLRSQLERVIARANVPVRRILLWRTFGMVANAAVIGIWGRIRYVMLSDALIESLPDEQIEGVFGHELGHVVHHHIIYYLLLVGSLMFWLGIAAAGIEAVLPETSRWRTDAELRMLFEGAMVAALAGVALVVFGWISRRFEEHADLVGAQAITLGGLDERHDDAVAPRRGEDCGLCESSHRIRLNHPPHEAAAELYAGGLFRIADMSGLDRGQHTWRHGSILARSRRVRSLCQPEKFRRFRLLIRIAKLAILAAAATAVGLVLLE